MHLPTYLPTPACPAYLTTYLPNLPTYPPLTIYLPTYLPTQHQHSRQWAKSAGVSVLTWQNTFALMGSRWDADRLGRELEAM